MTKSMPLMHFCGDFIVQYEVAYVAVLTVRYSQYSADGGVSPCCTAVVLY